MLPLFYFFKSIYDGIALTEVFIMTLISVIMNKIRPQWLRQSFQNIMCMSALAYPFSYRETLWSISCGIQIFWVVSSNVKYETILLLLNASLIYSIHFVIHKRKILQQQSVFQGSDPPPQQNWLLCFIWPFKCLVLLSCSGVACLPVHSLYFISIFSHANHQIFTISSLCVFYSANQI